MWRKITEFIEVFGKIQLAENNFLLKNYIYKVYSFELETNNEILSVQKSYSKE